MQISGKNILSIGDCKGKVPEEKISSICSRNSKGAVWLECSG